MKSASNLLALLCALPVGLALPAATPLALDPHCASICDPYYNSCVATKCQNAGDLAFQCDADCIGATCENAAPAEACGYTCGYLGKTCGNNGLQLFMPMHFPPASPSPWPTLPAAVSPGKVRTVRSNTVDRDPHCTSICDPFYNDCITKNQCAPASFGEASPCQQTCISNTCQSAAPEQACGNTCGYLTETCGDKQPRPFLPETLSLFNPVPWPTAAAVVASVPTPVTSPQASTTTAVVFNPPLNAPSRTNISDPHCASVCDPHYDACVKQNNCAVNPDKYNSTLPNTCYQDCVVDTCKNGGPRQACGNICGYVGRQCAQLLPQPFIPTIYSDVPHITYWPGDTFPAIPATALPLVSSSFAELSAAVSTPASSFLVSTAKLAVDSTHSMVTLVLPEVASTNSAKPHHGPWHHVSDWFHPSPTSLT